MTTTIAALLAFLFPLAYSPGPGNMFFAANGARFGMRATLRANLGYHVATWIVATAIGFGAMAAFTTHPGAFQALKLVGSLYVLWLAWTLFRSGGQDAAAEAAPAGFGAGVLLLLFNPKAYVIMALMFTQFAAQAQGADAWRLVLVIATVFTLNNLVAFLAWTAAGDRLARRFREDRSARRINRSFGAVLAAVAVWMAFA
ncbi:LysE family translocator [Albimonas sp. CAU 1670]|uniref:LysE family translocator n=1 Tax=Albimonas sp. CAU 1670 TaxID=3032599 RepID=UPI0023DA62A0|nr:LysE family translocator [Albimonas sp. CAU 1670]MDF2231482.1 LysE family translocator [Albimonas sp. CAU 1670]